MKAENLAQLFHQSYEKLAPVFFCETRKISWENLPEKDKNLMIAVCQLILSKYDIVRKIQ